MTTILDWQKTYDKAEIIENSRKAVEKFGTRNGWSLIALDEEQIQALLDGKALAYDDGEYSHFIVMEDRK